MKPQEESTVLVDFFARFNDLFDKYFPDEDDDTELMEDEAPENIERVFFEKLDIFLKECNYDVDFAMARLEAHVTRFFVALYKASKEATEKSKATPVLTAAETAEYAAIINEMQDDIPKNMGIAPTDPKFIELKEILSPMLEFFKANMQNVRQAFEQRISETQPELMKVSLPSFRPMA